MLAFYPCLYIFSVCQSTSPPLLLLSLFTLPSTAIFFYYISENFNGLCSLNLTREEVFRSTSGSLIKGKMIFSESDVTSVYASPSEEGVASLSV